MSDAVAAVVVAVGGGIVVVAAACCCCGSAAVVVVVAGAAVCPVSCMQLEIGSAFNYKLIIMQVVLMHVHVMPIIIRRCT